MASVFDVAEAILEITGFVSTMKLQKLAYYSQALSLVSTGEPLFSEDFQAWANGPVCPALFDSHRGRYVVGRGELSAICNPRLLNDVSMEVIRHVIFVLGEKSGKELSDLTHSEAPWIEARDGCADGECSRALISKDSIKAFYSSADCCNPLFSK